MTSDWLSHELCTRSEAWNRTCLERSLVLAPEHLGDSPKKRVCIWAGPQSSLDSSRMASEEKRDLLPAEEKGREGRSSERRRTTVAMDHLNVPILVPLVDYLTQFLPRMFTYVPCFFACISTCNCCSFLVRRV